MSSEQEPITQIAAFVDQASDCQVRPLAQLAGMEQEEVGAAFQHLPLGTRLLYQTHGLIEQADNGGETFGVTALQSLPTAITLAAKRFP